MSIFSSPPKTVSDKQRDKMTNPISNHDMKVFSGLSSPDLSRRIARLNTQDIFQFYLDQVFCEIYTLTNWTVLNNYVLVKFEENF